MPFRGDNPFEEIEEMLSRMGREIEADPWAPSVPVDVADRGDAFVVTADLPGFAKEDVEVTLADRTLRIEAERETEVAGDFLRHERHREEVSRAVTLPEAVDEEAIEATHANGVLTVTLPKRDADGGTRIEIE